MTIITPTVGRSVWFYSAPDAEPQAAIITRVWGDRMVNLCVFNFDGTTKPRTSVWLLQEGDAAFGGDCRCEWMPYQKGQAAKTEALQAAAAVGTGGYDTDYSRHRALELAIENNRNPILNNTSGVVEDAKAFHAFLSETEKPKSAA